MNLVLDAAKACARFRQFLTLTSASSSRDGLPAGQYRSRPMSASLSRRMLRLICRLRAKTFCVNGDAACGLAPRRRERRGALSMPTKDGLVEPHHDLVHVGIRLSAATLYIDKLIALGDSLHEIARSRDDRARDTFVAADESYYRGCEARRARK